MIKKTITLQTLLNLTEYLEKEIALTQGFVISNNSVLKSKEDETMKKKVREQFEKRQKCQTQLQQFKLAKTKANMEILEDVENNSRIFELSDLKRDERFYTALLGQKSKTKKGSKEYHYSFFIPKSELENELQKTEERISELKNQMSEFNESFEVEVEIDENLDLI